MGNPSPQRDAREAVRSRAFARLGHGVFQLVEKLADEGWIEVQAWSLNGKQVIDGVEPERYRPIVGDMPTLPVSSASSAVMPVVSAPSISATPADPRLTDQPNPLSIRDPERWLSLKQREQRG